MFSLPLQLRADRAPPCVGGELGHLGLPLLAMLPIGAGPVCIFSCAPSPERGRAKPTSTVNGISQTRLAYLGEKVRKCN